jgi:hypothetical protein
MKKFMGIKLGTVISVILSLAIAVLIWLYVGYTNDQSATSVFEQLLI